MLSSDHAIHHTEIFQIMGAAGEGWEFCCNDCGFRARYYLSDCYQKVKLEIINLGDLYARHLSDSLARPEDQDEYFEGGWLTPEIRRTIQRIVEKLDN